MRFYAAIALVAALFFTTQVYAGTYNLVIEEQPVNITGKTVNKITINDTIPGPTLRFKEGEDVTIHVTNKLDEPSSVHWHGLLLPGYMDGVPGFNGYPGIAPGETFTYQFKIRQSGTYWYHAHSVGQEQDGHYGSIVIEPKQPRTKADRDYVIVLSDFHEDSAEDIMANLKKNAEYYQYNRRTLFDFFRDAKTKGLNTAWETATDWGKMRMLQTDLADVTGYTFLTNGKTPDQNWTGLFKAGEKVRLRFINAAAMTFFDVRIPGLKMTVIEADGQPVEPITVDEFRFGVAETYDVIVEPDANKAYTIAAEPLDRTGFAIGTLAPDNLMGEGIKGEIPEPRKRSLLTMADMGMAHEMDHSPAKHNGDHSSMSSAEMRAMQEQMVSGWKDADTPEGNTALDYKDLRYLGEQDDLRAPEREVVVTLGGNMERYIWTMNGKRYSEADVIKLNYGERVRLKFVNETMMAHPMHLHGMFFQLENGQPAAKLPNKHTVVVAPGDSYSVLVTADEAGEWAFHCHLLYHMSAGMMRKVVVAELDENEMPPETQLKPTAKEMKGMHHGH